MLREGRVNTAVKRSPPFVRRRVWFQRVEGAAVTGALQGSLYGAASLDALCKVKERCERASVPRIYNRVNR